MRVPWGTQRSWALCLIFALGVVNAQFGRGIPRYNMDHLPETRFTCEGKLPGRYYADQETDCQMFHVCTKMSSRDVSNYRFLCPNGTVFDQEHQVCADYYQVACHINGANPLGQIFELYKLNSKESTNRQEFGEAPVQDPDYIGQNSLGGGEDFQAEEYNNNKLAASQNSLPYQTYEKPNAQNIFYQTISTQRPASPTTERPATPRPARKRVSTTTTTEEPIYHSPTPTESESTSTEIDWSDFSALSKFQNNFHKSGFTPRTFTTGPSTTGTPTTTYAPYVEYSTEQRYFETESTPVPTTSPTRRPTTTRILASNPDDIDFSDFSALSKFQYNFHHGFTEAPSTTTATEDQTFRDAPRSQQFVNSNINIRPVQQFETTTTAQSTTTPIATTTRRPPTTSRTLAQQNSDTINFNDFASLSKFQNDFHRSGFGATQAQSTAGRSEVVRLEVSDYTTAKPTTTFIKSIKVSPTPEVGKIDFSDFGSLSKFQHDFHHNKPSATPKSKLSEFHVLLTKVSSKPFSPTTTTTTTQSPPPARQDSGEYQTNDFSFPKYQNSFQPSFPQQQAVYEPVQQYVTTTQRPTTTSTTARTTRPTRPTPPSPVSKDAAGEFKFSTDFSDFASLSKFQHNFHHSFTQAPTTESAEVQNQDLSNFNTKPRTETEAPLFNFQQSTTRRSPTYQSTFRTTFTDLTTAAPPTFQQQATNFGDDFFIRQPTEKKSTDSTEVEKKLPTPIKFSPVYQEKPKPQITKKAQAYDESEVETFPPKTKHVEPTTSHDAFTGFQEPPVSTSARPIRRGRKRINPTSLQKSVQPYEPQYKYSRRVQNARFEDRESYAVRERSHTKNDEIFDAEASVFRGPAHGNTFYQRPAAVSQEQQSTQAPTPSSSRSPAVEENRSEPTTTTGHVFGRRVRPHRREQAQGRRVADRVTEVSDSGEVKQSGKTRVVKRLRQKTTPESITVVSPIQPEVSTNATANKSQPSRVRKVTVSRRIGGEREITTGTDQNQQRGRIVVKVSTTSTTTTTTPEPELVTASQEEVERLRKTDEKKAPSTFTTEKSPTTKIIPIIPKESLKKAKVDASKPAKPSDYDYSYYDTERDADYIDISNFGIKPAKSTPKH